MTSKGGDKVIYHFDDVKRGRITCSLSFFLWLICDYGNDFEIWWWFDCMIVLFNDLILWVADLVIDRIMVHDLFIVDGLCDDLCMELVCMTIYDHLGLILLNLHLRWCLLLGGDSVKISTQTTWVINLLLLFFSIKFSFLWWKRRRIHVFKFVNLANWQIV